MSPTLLNYLLPGAAVTFAVLFFHSGYIFFHITPVNVSCQVITQGQGIWQRSAAVSACVPADWHLLTEVAQGWTALSALRSLLIWIGECCVRHCKPPLEAPSQLLAWIFFFVCLFVVAADFYLFFTLAGCFGFLKDPIRGWQVLRFCHDVQRAIRVQPKNGIFWWKVICPMV